MLKKSRGPKGPKNEPTEKIIAYILANPIAHTKNYKYLPAAKKFNTSEDRIRRIYRTLRANGKILGETPDVSLDIIKKGEKLFKENIKNGLAELELTTDKRVKTLADLIKVCEIDLYEWDIISWEAGSWEMGRKDKQVTWESENGVTNGSIKDSGKVHVQTLYRVRVKLAKRRVEKDLEKQKDVILSELRHGAPSFTELKKYWAKRKESKEQSYLYEISIFDHHFGKLAHREETGEDYDLKIAVQRWDDAIEDLLSRVNTDRIGKILLPIGNDLFNVDNKNNTTTAFTPQDSDSRFAKVIRIVRETLIATINKLSLIAPVDVVCIPGNHDTLSVLWISEILSAWYHNNEFVNIDSSPKMRKYYQYGKAAIQFSHGNEEKHESLGLIFATEAKELWANTDYHYAQLGHFHKNKKLNFVSVDEFAGFQIQTLPSLSGTDFWHYKKGYMSKKSAKAFLFDHQKGLIGEFSHNL